MNDPLVNTQDDFDVAAVVAAQAQRLLEERATAERLRQLLDEPGSFDSDLWRSVIDLGWLSALISDDAEPKTESSWDLLADLVRIVGRYAASLPLANAVVVADLLLSQDPSTAAKISAGKSIVAVALADADALPEMVHGRISGEVPNCAFAAVADLLLVAVRNSEEVLPVLVDTAGAKVSKTVARTLDNARGAASISLDGAPAMIVGDVNLLEQVRSAFALMTAFEQIGGAERCLELSCDYARERRAFGQPIGSFQAIKHKLADFYGAIELARGCAHAALSHLKSGSTELRKSAAAAVLAATDAYEFAATETIQVFGAIGVTWEALPHHYYTRARALAVETGSRFVWRDVLAKALLEDNAAGSSASLSSGGTGPATVTIDGYRARARAWLAEHAPAYENIPGESVEEKLARGRRWQALKSEYGYSAIMLPRIYGGGGGTDLERIIFAEEELRYDLPTVFFGVSLNMTVPTFSMYASEVAKAKLLPPAIRGEHIWCQLFSEPAAGSDLAALRLTARRDGDGWRLDGQKIWTSWAQYSDWGYIAARTDPSLPKHKGLTCFYLDMHSAGIEVRGIRRIGGDQEINEVFFDDVYVPDSQRMGEVNGGFGVILATLMIERYALNDPFAGGPKLDQLITLARTVKVGGLPASDDGEIRRAIAMCYVEWLGQQSIHERAMTKMTAGAEPGPEGSIRKLLAAKARQRLATVALDMMGPAGLQLDPARNARDDFTHSWLDAPQLRIAGGTDDILRNTIAEKILHLPQDHRPDKGVPFKRT
jgi:alkylation response protein AidB-like acyl-CoA dehydrogenase